MIEWSQKERERERERESKDGQRGAERGREAREKRGDMTNRTMGEQKNKRSTEMMKGTKDKPTNEDDKHL